MPQFRNKEYNANVFEKYLRTLPSTKENSLIKNALFVEVNKYGNKLSEQAGGYFITEPIKGRIGGEPVNLDGVTNIPDGTERETYKQTKIAFGRAASWGEDDFTATITGTNFMAEAQEVKEYWDGEMQKTVLSILKGIAGITDGKFNEKHTYEVAGELNADSCNRAAQKALGDKKGKLEVMFMHSAVSTNLESLQLLNFLKYTDKDGIERDLTIATYNGRLVIVDDDMPTKDVAKSGDTEAYTEYTTYMFKKGFFEHEQLAVEVPSEVVRDAKTRGGRNELISRNRHVIVPTLISYKATDKLSPENKDFERSANWGIVNNGKTGNDLKYVDDKLIPFVVIKSRG